MAKPVTVLVVFFVALNLFAGTLAATGVDQTLGLDASTGGDSAVDERTSNDNVSGGTGTGETLTNLRNVLSNQFASLIGIIFPGLAMLNRAGVPQFITNLLGGMFSVMTTIAVIRFFRSGEL